MWNIDDDFKKKVRAQKCFCVRHFTDFTTVGVKELGKKQFPDFYEDTANVFASYFNDLRSDVSWFCKKFDYRYQDEPWYNAKDSVERAVALLSSDVTPEKPK